MTFGAKRENSLLGSAFFLVAASAAEGGIETVKIKRCLSASVFITWVCTDDPEVIGLMPRATPS